jgi:hypothetical protein
MPEEVVERTLEQIALDFSAMGNSVSLIADVISGDRRAEYTAEDRQKCVDRNVQHLKGMLTLEDWGDEDMTAVNESIITGNNYTAS